MSFKHLDHKTESVDISKWNISKNIRIIYHGNLYKLPRDVAKNWINLLKNVMSFRKRYGVIFQISIRQDDIFIAFFDNMEKVKIFATANMNDMSQLEPLTTELWNLSIEFENVRYSNSFDIGKTIVLETNECALDIHGSKRYFRCLSCSQAVEWFDNLNSSIHNGKKKKKLSENELSEKELSEEDLSEEELAEKNKKYW
jgi:hypothetical protein